MTNARLGLTALLAVVVMSSAHARAGQTPKVAPCEDAHVGISSLIAPVANNSRSFYDGRVMVYAVDQGEPVCCSYGVTIVMALPEADGGGLQCIAAMGASGLALERLTTSYDAARGLLLSIPARWHDADTDTYRDGRPFKLRINMAAGTVTAE
ncbi:MAG: hypothetical protein NW217_03895 [Hyphomicrobiaceae bacterium]|nr:hypothetical protein [Hyphomicrobiaceae bacterium]